LVVPRGRAQRFTEAQVAQAVRDCRGVVTAVATKLGCIPGTVYDYVKRYPALADVLDQARELGFYFEGLGFHSFRRSNITRIQSTAGASAIEAQLHAGHSRVSMTSEYTQIEPERHQKSIRKMQEAALGESQVVH